MTTETTSTVATQRTDAAGFADAGTMLSAERAPAADGPTRVVPLRRAAVLTDFCEQVAAWREIWQSDPQAGILQAPEVCCAELMRTEAPHSADATSAAAAGGVSAGALILTDGQGGHAFGGRAAVLLPKRMRSADWGILGLPVQVDGYRLAGNRVLTAAGGEATDSGRAVRSADEAAATDSGAESNAARSAAVLQEAVSWVRSVGGSFLLLEDVEVGSMTWRAAEAVTNAVRIVPRGTSPRHWIEFSEDADAYWQQFSSKTRNTFRRKRKRFPDLRVTRCRSAADVPEFLDAAAEVSSTTWQTQQLGTRIRRTPEEAAWLTAVAELGGLRSYVLWSGSTPAAFLLGFQSAGVFVYEEVGYAAEFARQSAGQVLLLEVLDDLFAADTPQRLDFGAGDADYKRLFANRTTSGGYVCLVPNPMTAVALRSFCCASRGIRRVGRAVRNVLKRTGR